MSAHTAQALVVRLTCGQQAKRLDPRDLEQLDSRADCDVLEVPVSTIGFIMGPKAATLRDVEGRHFVFLIFDDEETRGPDPAKRLYTTGVAPQYLERMSTDSADFCTRRLLSTFPRRASRKDLLNRVVVTRCDTTFLGTSGCSCRCGTHFYSCGARPSCTTFRATRSWSPRARARCGPWP